MTWSLRMTLSRTCNSYNLPCRKARSRKGSQKPSDLGFMTQTVLSLNCSWHSIDCPTKSGANRGFKISQTVHKPLAGHNTGSRVEARDQRCAPITRRLEVSGENQTGDQARSSHAKIMHEIWAFTPFKPFQVIDPEVRKRVQLRTSKKGASCRGIPSWNAWRGDPSDAMIFTAMVLQRHVSCTNILRIWN